VVSKQHLQFYIYQEQKSKNLNNKIINAKKKRKKKKKERNKKEEEEEEKEGRHVTNTTFCRNPIMKDNGKIR
jgi:hypothetical protein